MAGTYTAVPRFYKAEEHEGLASPSYAPMVNANWDLLQEILGDMMPANGGLYFKRDGTPEDLVARDDFIQHTNAVGRCYLPKGNFYMPDGEGLFESLAGGVVIEGAGKRNTIISTKNAYAFQTPASGALDAVSIQHLGTTLRTGSTSGGGIKAVSDSYHAGWDLGFLECSGASTSVNPLVHVDGWIGSYIDMVQVANCGGDGLSVAAAGFPSNSWGVSRIRAASCAYAGTSYAGVRLSGARGTFGPGILESNRGHGLVANGGILEIFGFHFEDNWNSNITGEMSNSTIHDNGFFFNDAAAEPTSRHIKLVCTTGPGNRHFNRIENNTFQDGSASGISIDIGVNVEDTFIGKVRGADFGSGSILDNGTRTVSYQTDNPYGQPNELKLPGGDIPLLKVKTPRTAAGSGGDPSGPETIVSFSDKLGSNYLMVGSRGIPIFKTGTPSAITGSDELQIDSFAPYWDDAAGQVKIRVRNHSGAYATFVAAAPAASANPDTSGASLGTLETEVNQLKAALRTAGILTP